MAALQCIYTIVFLCLMGTEVLGLARTRSFRHGLHHRFLIRFALSWPQPGAGSRLSAEWIFLLRLLFRQHVRVRQRFR